MQPLPRHAPDGEGEYGREGGRTAQRRTAQRHGGRARPCQLIAVRGQPWTVSDSTGGYFMRIETLTWSQEHGWSGPFPPATPERTLILAFGESAFLDDPAPLAELVAAYPDAAVTGCSGAGQFATMLQPTPGQG